MKAGLFASVATAALTIGTVGFAQSLSSVINTIFLVDESGSMAGEQNFLQQFVLDIDPALQIAGFNDRRYGLLGFAAPGNLGPANLNEFAVGGGQLGSAQEFATAAQGLVTTGGTEDGYAAINYALNNYAVSGATTFVLVTDEDRDNTDGSLDFAAIRDALVARGVNVAAMLDVTILNDDGNVAISTDGITALTQDGQVFKSVGFDQFSSGSGATIADYAELALATNGGCVADLNQLRSGGDAAAAFAAAFETCVIAAATEAGIVAILTVPVRDSTLTVAQDIRQKLRLLAQAMSMSGSNQGSGVLSTQGQVVDEVFRISGLRAYANITGTFGSLGGGNDIDSHGIIAGLDYTFDTGTARARIGGALSFVDGDIRGNTGRLGTDTWQGSLYGVYRMASGLQFSGDLQYGDTDMNSTRLVGLASVRGKIDSEYKSIGLEAGKRFDLPDTNAVVMPYLGLRQERIDQNSYIESNGGIVPSFQQDLSTASLGVRYELNTLANFGNVETIIDVSWHHLFDDDLNVGAGTVALAPGSLDDNRFELGINLAIDTSDNSRLSLNLSGARDSDISIASVGLGFQMNF